MSWLLDEVDDYVSIADHAALTLPNGDWAIAGWYKLAANTGNQSKYIHSWGNYKADNNTFHFLQGEASNVTIANRVELSITTSTSLVPSQTTPGTTLNAWQHFIIERASSVIQIYRNDAVLSSSLALASNRNRTDPWIIGARSDFDTNRFFGGKLAAWAKWDRVLTAGEKTSLAGGTDPATLSPVWYIPMLDDFLEDVAGMTLTANGGIVTDSDHPFGVGSVKGVRVQLFGTSIASLSSLQYAFFDEATPSTWLAPIKQGSDGTTSSGGVFSLNLDGETALDIGEIGYLYLANTNGTVSTFKHHAGPIAVVDLNA